VELALLAYIFVVTVVNQLGTQRRRRAELAEKQRDELAHEIQLAAEVQQSILPRSIPTVPGFEFAARMYPAKIVAGDYYGFIELPEGEIGLVIADVSGKGSQPACLCLPLKLPYEWMPHDPPAQRIYYEGSTRSFARSPAETASFLCSMENCAFGHTPWSIQMPDTIPRS
jgi:hypothetical protein